MEEAFETRLESGVTPGPADGTLHTMFGAAVLLLVVIRLIVRLVQGAPGAPEGTAPALASAAHWGHRLIYALMIAAPLGGMAAWFGGIATVGEIHGTAGKALMLVVLGHALMAIYHEAVVRDGTMQRMFRPGDRNA